MNYLKDHMLVNSLMNLDESTSKLPLFTSIQYTLKYYELKTKCTDFLINHYEEALKTNQQYFSKSQIRELTELLEQLDEAILDVSNLG